MFALLFTLIVSAQSAHRDLMGEVSDWKPVESTGVRLKLSQEITDRGRALRLDYDYQNRGGFVLAQRDFPTTLGPDFEFSFWVKANSPRNNFEFKLMDPSGENVWWVNRVAYDWPTAWRQVVIRRRHLQFAWGPKPGAVGQIGALQIGVAANAGGSGTVWITGFQYRELPPAAPFSPKFSTNTTPAGTVLDLGAVRELGGLITTWRTAPGRVQVATSPDAKSWSADQAFDLKRDQGWIVIPETQARYIRLGSGTAKLVAARLLPVEATDTANHLLLTLGREGASGVLPRTVRGLQSFWTVVGSPSGSQEILINQDGQVEFGQGLPSIIPSVTVGGAPTPFSSTSANLEQNDLPLPTAHLTGRVQVAVTPVVTAQPGGDLALVRYRVANPSEKPQTGTLDLRILPMQVNAPWQFLNREGGFSPIDKFSVNGSTLMVDGRAIQFSKSPSSWEQEPIVPNYPGCLSACLRFRFDLKPGAHEDVVASWVLPGSDAPAATPNFDVAYAKETARWESLLGEAEIQLPAEGKRWAEVAKSNLGYVLVNRDGPAIQPGSRSYERTWIRDGSMTSAALLRYGRFQEVKELIEWYSRHIATDGWVPCVVDRRGADPVPEHDSHGQYLYLLAEYLRFSGDKQTVAAHFDTVKRVVAGIERLRETNRTPAARKSHWFDMMPESISHEGYSAKPMHSYWDNFWIAKGLADAVDLAEMLGRPKEAAEFRSASESFRKNLAISLRGATAEKNINTLPGCVELGDFDATSSAIAVSPCDLTDVVDRAQLDATFEKYWRFFEARRLNQLDWVDYTPYEIRNVNAFLMRGQPERARQLMTWFLRDSYPAGWNHWAEIVHRNPKEGKWIGDMPHTWVGSEWMKAFRNLLVFETGDREWVAAAGVPEEWIRAKGGVRCRNLPVPGGRFGISAREDSGKLVYDVTLTAPSGKVRLRLPRAESPATVRVNGVAANAVSGEISLNQFPCRVEVAYARSGTQPGMR